MLFNDRKVVESNSRKPLMIAQILSNAITYEVQLHDRRKTREPAEPPLPGFIVGDFANDAYNGVDVVDGMRGWSSAKSSQLMKGKPVMESDKGLAVGIGKKVDDFSSGRVRVDGGGGESLDLERAQFLDSDDRGDQSSVFGSNSRGQNLGELCVNSNHKLSSLQGSSDDVRKNCGVGVVKLYVDLNLETDSTGDSIMEEVLEEPGNLGWIFNEGISVNTDADKTRVVASTNVLSSVGSSLEKRFVEVKKSAGHYDNGFTDVGMKFADISECSNHKRSQAVKVERTGQVITQDHISEKEGDDSNVVILDVDLNPEIPDKFHLGRTQGTLKPKFHAADLVWCRARRRKWWPGQILEPSAASENAKKSFKEDNYLIAHFGVHTFSWTSASNMMPFEMHFSRTLKQTASEEFDHAVDCALEEISRRVEFGLSCSCLPEQVYTRLKTQLIFNDGIREQCSRRDGGGRNLKATALKPKQLINYVKSIAQSPCNKPDKLEFVVARSLISAFYRYKGYSLLPELEMSYSLLMDDINLLQTKEKSLQNEIMRNGGQTSDHKRKVPSQSGSQTKEKSLQNEIMTNGGQSPDHKRKVSSQSGSQTKEKSLQNEIMRNGGQSSDHKRKVSSQSRSQPLKKDKSILHAMYDYGKQLSSSMDESVSEENTCKELVSCTPVKKRRMILDTSDEEDTSNELVNCGRSNLSTVTPQPLKTVGMNKLNSSLWRRNGTFQEAPRKHLHDVNVSHECQQKKLESSDTTKEMFSRLCSAAADPFHKHSFLEATVFFFTGFSIFSRKHNGSSQQDQNISQENMSDTETEEKTTHTSSDTSDVEILTESSWKDRLTERSQKIQTAQEIQNGSAESLPECHTKTAVISSKPKLAAAEVGPSLSSELQNFNENNPPISSDESSDDECYPTALCLKFTSLASLLETNLSEIFSCYGPLVESEILPKSKRARLVFRRRADAETAFTNVGKHRLFQTSLVSYRLKYMASKSKIPASTKRGRQPAKH